MAAEKMELRVTVDRTLLQRVDAIGLMNGWDRTQTVVYMLGTASNRIHEKASVLLRMSGSNPEPLEVPEMNTGHGLL